ncbi:MAG TPA: hypothetical protein VE673_19930 [Pseudonocardiaceae bacterium]|nr:hypothetical protein [Pseudonocardiaceae bacterium]
MRAVTDDATAVVYDPARAPGVANLLDILAGCIGDQPQRLAAQFDRYGELKQAVTDAVVATLAPVRRRYLALTAEPEHLHRALRAGAKQVQQQASDKVRQARSAIGLLPA